jgi:hypothetical protein
MRLFYTASDYTDKEKAAMEDLNLYTLNALYDEPRGATKNTDFYAAEAARHLYSQACRAATFRRLWMLLTGRSNHLRTLPVRQPSMAGNARYAGLRSVSLAAICGSENRADDFDAHFHPLYRYNQSRWLSIATAILRGTAMPPVALIQVGNEYYVRDGHHRISVMRAMGQQEIDAEVLVWGYAASLPLSEECVQGATQPA